jgi:hypothetical protein
MMRRSLFRTLAVAGAVLAGLAPATPAAAATPEIVVSSDGSTFTPDLTANVFDDLALIVPGDAMASSVWVRNQSTASALVRVAVTDLVVPSPEFGAAVTLSSTMNGFTHIASLDSLSDCQVVVETQTVPAGVTVRIDFEVLMSSATSGADAQGQTASMGFVVTAHDWAAGPFPDANGCSSMPAGGPGGGGGAPLLPWTGAGEVLSTVFVALALIGCGALFAVLRRRRDRDRTRTP